MGSVIETRPRLDRQLELIADGTRRHLLVALLDGTPGDTPIDIVDRIEEAAAVSWIEMQHVHLPKLEDSGFIRWDRENRFVRRGPQFDEIEPLLTVLHDHADQLPDE